MISICEEGWSGDGYCDDACNHPGFNFDDGDCCMEDATLTYCKECFCYETCSYHNASIFNECYSQTHPNENLETCNWYFVGDMICDDECNHPKYFFDGGDCCVEVVYAFNCTDCFCYETCSHHDLITNHSISRNDEIQVCYELLHLNSFYLNCYELILGDGFCDQECNHPEFLFDGGDCCLEYVNTNWCEDCFCYATCSYHNLILDPGPPVPPSPPIISTTTPLPELIAGTEDVNSSSCLFSG